MMSQIAQQLQITLPNNVKLLGLYKEEKDLVSFPSDDYPSFNVWKETYLREEFIPSHIDSKSVDVETAILLTEAELSIETEVVVEKEKTVKKVVETKVKDTVPKVQKEKTTSKSVLAESIYKEMMIDGVHPIRKDVIKRFIEEVGLTSAGASTYQYNIKKKLSQ